MLGWIVGCRWGRLDSDSTESEQGLSSTAATETALGNWVRLIEAAADEEQTVDLREAAAISIRRSSVLQWSVASAHRSLCLPTSSLADRSAASTLATLCCRVWLAAAVLMQDDDDDVREAINAAVTLVPSVDEVGVQSRNGIFTVPVAMGQQYSPPQTSTGGVGVGAASAHRRVPMPVGFSAVQVKYTEECTHAWMHWCIPCV